MEIPQEVEVEVGETQAEVDQMVRLRKRGAKAVEAEGPMTLVHQTMVADTPTLTPRTGEGGGRIASRRI